MSDILSQISYLDNLPDPPSAGAGLPQDWDALQYMIQREIAHHIRAQQNEAVAYRLAELETQVQWVMRRVEIQRRRPPVQYVIVSRDKDHQVVITAAPVPAKPKVPTAMVLFYGAGLICSLVFAVLLALSTMGVVVIHPFLSLLGLVGGLGWLTTAWTDLLLWKRESPSANEFTQQERNITSVTAR
jgi:hypothetical protein